MPSSKSQVYFDHSAFIQQNRMERKMNLLQLRYFQHLAKIGHFTRAASELNLTQSALSSCIRRIEAELGCQLFYKTGRTSTLSDAGQVFLRHVEAILNEYDDALQELHQLDVMTQKELSLATTSVQFHQDMAAEFSAHFPDIIIRQQIIKISEIPAKANNSAIDMIISSHPYQAENICCKQISSEPLLLAIPRDHPLADRNTVTLEDVKDLSFISLPAGYAYREQLERTFLDAGYQMKVVFESFPEQFPKLVARKIGAALATESSILLGNYPSSIKTIPFEGDTFQRSLYLIWRTDRKMSQAARLFFDHLISKKENDKKQDNAPLPRSPGAGQ